MVKNMEKALYKVTFLREHLIQTVEEGTTVLAAEIAAGLTPDAPCGGRGTCGKCLVRIAKGRENLRWEEGGGPLPEEELLKACCLRVYGDVSIETPEKGDNRILTGGVEMTGTLVDETEKPFFALAAFDVGTTSLVGYLLDGRTGAQMAVTGRLNPQTQFGADVIARGSYAMEHGGEPLYRVIRQALDEMLGELVAKVNCSREDILRVSLVGNTCMHHLFLGLSPAPLMLAPYMPAQRDPMVLQAADYGLHIQKNGELWMLPCIAGFVGADTIGCLLAADWSRREPLTLMVDIGTNGEMVLGNRHRSIACSTAAGPAFEGAKIRCGMRGADGAIDHVFRREDGSLGFSVIGGGEAVGICGSGLLDAVAVLLAAGVLTGGGKIQETGHPWTDRIGKVDDRNAFFLTEKVCLTQEDIREVQLAKGAMAAGIRLLAKTLGVAIGDIQQVLIAGAFGNYMAPESACAIGLLPMELSDRIIPVGNAAGEGAKLAVADPEQFDLAGRLMNEVEFLELASDPDFQDVFVEQLMFSDEDEE